MTSTGLTGTQVIKSWIDGKPEALSASGRLHHRGQFLITPFRRFFSDPLAVIQRLHGSGYPEFILIDAVDNSNEECKVIGRVISLAAGRFLIFKVAHCDPKTVEEHAANLSMLRKAAECAVTGACENAGDVRQDLLQAHQEILLHNAYINRYSLHSEFDYMNVPGKLWGLW